MEFRGKGNFLCYERNKNRCRRTLCRFDKISVFKLTKFVEDAIFGLSLVFFVFRIIMELLLKKVLDVERKALLNWYLTSFFSRRIAVKRLLHSFSSNNRCIWTFSQSEGTKFANDSRRMFFGIRWLFSRKCWNILEESNAKMSFEFCSIASSNV